MIHMPFDDFDLQVQCEEVYTEEEYMAQLYAEGCVDELLDE